MRARFIAPWKDSTEKPVIYHCVSRVVDRRFAFGKDEKEKLRTYMRMYESFSGVAPGRGVQGAGAGVTEGGLPPTAMSVRLRIRQ